MIDVGQVRAVTFDGDNTLWDLRSAETIALTAVASHIREHSARCVTVAELRAARDAAAPGGGTLASIRRQSFAAACPDLSADDLLEVFFAARYPASALYDDVLPALGALEPEFELALLTNGNTHAYRFGLESMLRLTFMSEERGVAKPDPQFYRDAASALNVPPQQILHVGDSASDDVDAAGRAGMQAVLLDRSLPSSTMTPYAVADLLTLASALLAAR